MTQSTYKTLQKILETLQQELHDYNYAADIASGYRMGLRFTMQVVEDEMEQLRNPRG